jgi:phosphoethanolamine N-methyltransferase
MAHENEYHDAMVDTLELIWGEGFMAPGGEGNVTKMIEGLDLEGKRVLDIGCGLGGPACILASKYGAHVVGTDLEAPLIDRARRRAADVEVSDRTEFLVVEAGPLEFEDESFDLVMSSGGLTQTTDKPGTFRDCLRVLKPGGTFSLYDWMKCEGEYSADMRYWFEMEGLTYAMLTPREQEALLEEAGFAEVSVTDCSPWYTKAVREEYERVRSDCYASLVEIVGAEQADHTIENWRATVVVCEKGEMLQVYSRARRPESASS